MEVMIVGIGMGDVATCTLGVERAITEADLLIGAPRMLQAVERFVSCEHAVRRVEAISPTQIHAILFAETASGDGASRACIVCSGDTGFFSLATSIRRELEDYDVVTLPGITTVQYLAARLGRPWQGCTLVSAHGLACDVLGHVLAHEDVFFLTGGEITPESIIGVLIDAGLEDVEVTVGERLSYADERISTDSALALSREEFDSLSSVWVHRNDLRAPELAAYPTLMSGIPDEAFVRGKTPMTKQEVRACALAKLGLRPGDTFFDVGAGTGSISCEAALASPFISVFAIEADDEAQGLIAKNRVRFGAYNITVVAGIAPQVFEELPAPDVVFIGGSKGNLAAIVEAVLAANPAVRIVASAIALETIAEAQAVFSSGLEDGHLADYEVVQIGVNRTRELGAYHLLCALNPIMLFSACGTGEKGGHR